MSVEIPQRSGRVTWAPVPFTAAVLAATLAVVVVSPVRFAYAASSTRVALETGIALAALLSAYLLLGRWPGGLRSGRLLLGAALVTLAVTSLLLAGVLAVAPDTRPRVVLNTGALAGAALLAASAFGPLGGRHPPRRTLAVWALALVAAYAVVRLATAGPLTLPDLEEVDGDAPYFHGRAGILVVHVLSAALFGLAAFGFGRAHAHRGDELCRWLALAALCLAFARGAYSLFPPVPASWVHLGDVSRGLAYVLVLVGALRGLQSHWNGLAAAAVVDERRRIARELHDGVAQEIALIQRRAPELARGGQAEALGPAIAAAAARAAQESRRAIDLLVQPVDEPLDRALARAAEHAVAGTDVRLSLRLAAGVATHPDVREHLVRIASEAMANATRHASPGTIQVEFDGGRAPRLRVVDDGAGFEPGRRAAGNGFGLVSMRERAALIGAKLTVNSRPGGGTEVRVDLP